MSLSFHATPVCQRSAIFIEPVFVFTFEFGVCVFARFSFYKGGGRGGILQGFLVVKLNNSKFLSALQYKSVGQQRKLFLFHPASINENDSIHYL